MNNKTNNGPSREWLLRMAEKEDACPSVSAGGMAADFGMLPVAASETHHAFGRLIEFARRRKSLSVERLAQLADVDMGEILEIETKCDVIPQVRTVYQLANVLDLPQGRLLEVAGLAEPRAEVTTAALKFAARSESTAKLTSEEREAFEEFVKVLVESSDGG